MVELIRRETISEKWGNAGRRGSSVAAAGFSSACRCKVATRPADSDDTRARYGVGRVNTSGISGRGQLIREVVELIRRETISEKWGNAGRRGSSVAAAGFSSACRCKVATRPADSDDARARYGSAELIRQAFRDVVS